MPVARERCHLIWNGLPLEHSDREQRHGAGLPARPSLSRPSLSRHLKSSPFDLSFLQHVHTGSASSPATMPLSVLQPMGRTQPCQAGECKSPAAVAVACSRQLKEDGAGMAARTLVMMQSHAPIHSWMLFTKPVAFTGIPPGGGAVLSFSNRRLLRPHTTTTWVRRGAWVTRGDTRGGLVGKCW